MAAGWQQHAFTGGFLRSEASFFTHRFVPLPWNLNKYPENVLFVKQQKANKWATRTLFSSKSTIHFSFEGIYASLFHFSFKHLRTAAGTSTFQESIYPSIHLSIFFISNAERRRCVCWLLFSDYWLVLRFEKLDGRQRCPPPPPPLILRPASPTRVGDLICVLVEESCLCSIFNHQDDNKGRHGRNGDEQREHTFSLFSLGGLMLGFFTPILKLWCWPEGCVSAGF